MTSSNITTRAPATLTARRRWTILAVCALALFLVGLDTTIVTVGLRDIGTGLGVAPSQLAWAVDAYTVPFASLLITSGAMADRFGRRRVFQCGLVVFGLTSLACAAAPSIEVLIAARAVQGAGASMLTPVALSIVVNAMPDPKERALAIGAWGAMFGLSLAAGPVTGGALLAAFDWRALFWINAPVVLVAVTLTVIVVPASAAASPRKVDVPGQLLLILVLATGVTVLIEAPTTGWTDARVLVAIAVLVAGAVAFVAVESRRSTPLLEPSLFRMSSFTAAVVGALAVFIAFSMTLLLTTTMLQERGLSPLEAGAATLPMAVTATVCAPLSGILVGRIGPRVPLLLASICLLGGGAMLATLATGFSFPPLLAAFLLIGCGIGLANAPITNTAVNGLAPDRAGVASGVASTARQVGTAIGIALAGGLAATAAGNDSVTVALLPGWVGIAACGAVLLVCAVAAPRRRSRSGIPPIGAAAR